MAELSWPCEDELNRIREIVAAMAGRGPEEVCFAVSPYRICPLGAHIDHQGGTVSAMTINKGVLLGFVPSGGTEVVLRSQQFLGEVRFSVDDIQHPRPLRQMEKSQATDTWEKFPRGAVYALQRKGNSLTQGIIGYVCGSEGLDSSGLSSSAAVGVAYLLAFESVNNLRVPPVKNIEYDRLIENEYLGLKNGILDQSAILLSSHGCLTCINCKTKEYRLISPSKLQENQKDFQGSFKILLAFSGLRNALTNSPGYNNRVAECQEAASVLLRAVGNDGLEPLLCNVELEVYEAYKGELETNLAKRAEHYFSENMRVIKGIEAWASGNLEEFGKLISASGLSSIQNYECGCKPLIQLYEILLRTPGVYGARFSGAGFRGCCLAIVAADRAEQAASFVREEYLKAQPELASQVHPDAAVLICEAGDCARVI